MLLSRLFLSLSLLRMHKTYTRGDFFTSFIARSRHFLTPLLRARHREYGSFQLLAIYALARLPWRIFIGLATREPGGDVFARPVGGCEERSRENFSEDLRVLSAINRDRIGSLWSRNKEKSRVIVSFRRVLYMRAFLLLRRGVELVASLAFLEDIR